jgi:hypothetical protein
MRRLSLAIATLAALGTAAISSTPASAMDYPFCLQGRQTGYPGECQYQTYQQCRASASGRDASCGINPRVAFNQRPRGRNQAWQ